MLRLLREDLQRHLPKGYRLPWHLHLLMLLMLALLMLLALLVLVLVLVLRVLLLMKMILVSNVLDVWLLALLPALPQIDDYRWAYTAC